MGKTEIKIGCPVICILAAADLAFPIMAIMAILAILAIRD